MYSLMTLGLLAMDMVGTLRIVGFVVGIPLIIIWLASVKNTTGLFYEKKKIRATVFFGIPGIILLVLGIFLLATGAPMRTHFHVANYSQKEGRVEIDGKTYTIPSQSWQLVEIRTKAESFPIKGYLGDSVVFDTTMGGGSYIGNLGGDKVVIAEEVEYSASTFSSASEDLTYELLMGPGIARFSESIVDDLYDFDEEAPNSMSVSSLTSKVRKFDLQLTSEADLFKQFLDALGDDNAGLDSLMEGIGEDTIGTDEEIEEEEE